jgi:arsenate reductase-like glutaredoxin family protein
MSQYFYKNNLQKNRKTVSYLNANNIAVTFSVVSTATHNQLALNKITRNLFGEKLFAPA